MLTLYLPIQTCIFQGETFSQKIQLPHFLLKYCKMSALTAEVWWVFFFQI